VHAYKTRKWFPILLSHSSQVGGYKCLVRLQSFKKNDGIMYYSVKNAAVSCENHHEGFMQY